LRPLLTQTENDFKRRQAEFEALARELAEKELELATLENALAAFEKHYASIVGVLFAELDELEKQIAQELFRLNPDELHKTRFREAEKKARTSRESIKEQIQQAARQDFAPSEDLKSLFRRVAKTVHPDLSVNEEERAFRTRLMARANIAYKNADKEALEQILFEWEGWTGKSVLPETPTGELDRLERKIRQIQMHLVEIGKKIAQLKKSESYRLMFQVEKAERQGSDLLNDIANNLHQQILEAKARLVSLKQRKK
jgi:hypothetical protein